MNVAQPPVCIVQTKFNRSIKNFWSGIRGLATQHDEGLITEYDLSCKSIPLLWRLSEDFAEAYWSGVRHSGKAYRDEKLKSIYDALEVMSYSLTEAIVSTETKKPQQRKTTIYVLKKSFDKKLQELSER